MNTNISSSALPNLIVSHGQVFPVSQHVNEIDLWIHYKPIRKIGGGFSSWVLAAQRHSDNQDVAIKVIYNGKFNVYSGYKQLLPRELVALKKLEDVAGVIQILYCTGNPERTLLVLERPRNSMNLGDYLMHYGPCNEDQARFLMRQLVETQRVLLNKGVLFCDFKVENILIDLEHFQTKLIDFSMACFMNQPGEYFLSKQESKNLWPPEIHTSQELNPCKTISWMMGIVLYKILKGTDPFESVKESVEGCLEFPPLISYHCKGFLQQTLEPKGIARPKFEYLLGHCWFNKYPVLSVEQLELSGKLSTQYYLQFENPEQQEGFRI